MKYWTEDHIPVVFHNLSDCDAHIFIKHLGKEFNKNNIGVIAENKEKNISFNFKINVKLAWVTDKDGKEVRKKSQLRFIDSCRFIASSLDKLASNLDDDQNMRDFYTREDIFKLMRQKRVYPYEYMDSWENLRRQSYHQRMHFTTSWLRKVSVIKAMSMHNNFEILWRKKMLGCYHNTYLKTDVLLLAYVFQTF